MTVMAQQHADILRQVENLYPVTRDPGMPLVDLGGADFAVFERDYSQYLNSGNTAVEELPSPLLTSVGMVTSPERGIASSTTISDLAGGFAEYLFSQSPVVELLTMQRERRVGEPVAPSLELQLWVLQHGLDISHPRA